MSGNGKCYPLCDYSQPQAFSEKTENVIYASGGGENMLRDGGKYRVDSQLTVIFLWVSAS
ncbi:hypothetical protein SAMN05421679_102462 [Epilithonimonas pallida]|uniref:Uncharacterized protein n=1 Tax=Epilithonimonas pallida TaxID=373671 RepID=A0ABY1R272_9FLAO|nr:hypothetical protein SAMN05421679_102462 [Epilithonimonas pallida]